MRYIYNPGTSDGSPPAARGPHNTDPQNPKAVARVEFELRTRLLVRQAGRAIVVKCFKMETPYDDQETAELGPSLMKLVKLGYVQVLLNLEGVHVASGSLIGCLACLHREVVKAGGFLILFGVEPIVRNALRICCLDRTIEICENEAEAVAAYRCRQVTVEPGMHGSSCTQ